ncbi:MAG: hypothetical protein VX508_00740, partial [Pseudomonadota bacterium]|nr:hypothetical protein [Pseudomonadota bacterium]
KAVTMNAMDISPRSKRDDIFGLRCARHLRVSPNCAVIRPIRRILKALCGSLSLQIQKNSRLIFTSPRQVAPAPRK